jgi:hypothetical protein
MRTIDQLHVRDISLSLSWALMSKLGACVQLRLSTRMLQEVRVIDVEALGRLMNQLEQVTAWHASSSRHVL